MAMVEADTDAASEASRGGARDLPPAAFPAMPTDVLGPPSARPLPDGLRLAGRHVVLLTAIVAPSLLGIVWGWAVEYGRRSVIRPPVRTVAGDVAGVALFIVAVLLWLASTAALETAVARLADRRQVSVVSAYQAGLGRIRRLALDLFVLTITLVLILVPLSWARAIAYLAMGDVPLQEPERLAIALSVLGLAALPLLLLFRLVFVFEYAVLVPDPRQGDAVTLSWRLSAGHFREIVRTLLPVVVPFVLLSYGPESIAWLLGVGESANAALAEVTGSIVAQLLLPFLVAVRVLLWHRLRTLPSAGKPPEVPPGP